jgi:hypothetical protein
MGSALFKNQSNAPAAAAAQDHTRTQPQHGGVYELVNGELQVLEGGPPQPEAGAPPAVALQSQTLGDIGHE